MRKGNSGRREFFVLTLEEKKAAACVLAALVLGFSTQRYRASHPVPPAPPTAKEQRAAKLAERASAAKTRATHRAATVSRATPKPVPPAPDDE